MEIVLLLLAFLITLFSGGSEAARAFDYFQFVQQYPPTLCMMSNGPNGPCPPGVPLPSRFFIHGLWPSNFSAPHDECEGTTFDPHLLNKGQAADLAISWPSFTYRPNIGFWALEYDRHGTCSEALYTQTEYFAHAHYIWSIADAFDILSSDGITPGYTYYHYDIINSIRGALQGMMPSVMCRIINGHMYLHEIIICIDPGLANFVNFVRPSTCQGIIRYP